MKTIKGPGIFLAQFAGDAAPFNTLSGISTWAADLGFQALQMPTTDLRLFDLAKAAESAVYCDEISGSLKEKGLQISELSTHLQGQLLAVHPAYNSQFDAFAPGSARGDEPARREWAIAQMKLAARASKKSWAHRSRYVLRSARVALLLPLATAPRRTDRRGLLRVVQTVAPHP